MNNRLAIIGSVGVPANYGGFETLAEYLTRYLASKIKVRVYCSSKSYTQRQKSYHGARLVYLPFSANGIQSIPYDVFSLIHAFFTSNILLVLGVAGSFMFPLIRLFSRKKIIVNIDGLEHQREKWNPWIKAYLKFSEGIAVRFAHVVIADNMAIKTYVKKTYGKDAVFIPYGGDHFETTPLSSEVKEKYQIPDSYAFKVCRIEPENNIHLILAAFAKSKIPLLIIGNWSYSNYGKELYEKYKNFNNIQLLNPIYHQDTLSQIRSNCSLYIHGHSAGGTNPSLVEAMFLRVPILAYAVAYNKFTTNNLAFYFSNQSELENLLEKNWKEANVLEKTELMHGYALENYTWEKVTTKYYELF